MDAVLMIITILAAILLILIVLVQNSKGGGLDSTFGNANQLGGVSQSTETIEKAPWILACVIGVLSLITAVSFGDSNTIESTSIENVAPTQQNPVNNPFPANPSSEK